MSGIVSPTPSSLRERVIGMRFALIVIAVAALPGALRSLDEAFVERARVVPAAWWNDGTPMAFPLATPRPPMYVFSARPMVELVPRAPRIERVVGRWSAATPVVVEVTCAYPAPPSANTRCRSTHKTEGTKSRSSSAPIATPRASAGG